MLDLRVLGDLQVFLDGAEVSGLSSQPGRAGLFVYLSVERSATRDQLVGLFWPEHDKLKARHALSQTLHRLRGAIGESWLETEGERVAITADVQLDAATFEALVEAGQYERALALYRGPFLAGWYLADSASFEVWVDQQRARFERLHRRARREWVRVQRERGDIAAALNAAHEWVSIDPLDDEAQHRLIELLAENGQRAEALRQFDMFRHLLDEQQLTPLDDTLTLVEHLRQATEVGPFADTDVEDRVAAASVEPGERVEAQPVIPLPSAPRKRRSFMKLGAVAFVLLVTAGILLFGSLTPAARARRIALPPGGRVMLADFSNDTRDTLISAVVTEALRIDLERHLHSALADPAELAAVVQRMRLPTTGQLTGDTAREAALRAGIPAIIQGKVGAVGPGFVLSAWIVATQNGRILDAALSAARDSTELIDAIETLSQRLRTLIRPSLATLPGLEPLEQVTTPSLDALRKYTAATRIWRQEGDGARAIELLEEATAQDSTFAMAHRTRAVILLSFRADPRALVDAFEAAYRHRNRLSEPERSLMIAGYHQFATGQTEAAIRAYENLLAVDTAQVNALNNLAVIYRGKRDFARAEALLQRCVAADSLSFQCMVNLTGVVHAQGRVRDARAIALRNLSHYPQNPMVRGMFVTMAAAAHQYDKADSLLTGMRGRGRPNPATAEIDAAALDMVRGRASEAQQHLKSSYQLAERSEPLRALGALMQQAWLQLYIRSDTARALAEMDRARRDAVTQRIAATDVPYLEFADFYLNAGDLAAGQAMLERFLSDVPLEMRREQDRRLYSLRGLLAMQQGQFAEALQAFRIADNYAGSPFIVQQYLGPFYDRAQRRDAAVEAYERYLSLQTLDRSYFDCVLLPGVLERLATLYEAQGRNADAVRMWTSFTELWKQADPELRPRLQHARLRIEALTRRS